MVGMEWIKEDGKSEESGDRRKKTGEMIKMVLSECTKGTKVSCCLLPIAYCLS